MTGDRVFLEIEQPSDVIVRTDETKLSQIVRNFISNAIKYTNDGTIRVWSEIVAGRLTIHVRDSGIGIPPQYLDTIFEEFMQVENPLQTRSKGTGLGLPLSRRLAQLLGGDVTVASRLGEGSHFRVNVPVELLRPQAPETPPAGDGRARVLIIDDDETSRYVLRAMLPPDCSVEEASDGPEGIRRAKEGHPDVVFVDVLMPTMNGIEVVKRLRHDPSTAQIPVIVRTSKTLTLDERRTLEEEGVLSVLGKTDESVDRSMEELRAILHRARRMHE
jgi:CheY-like chemotaxis protein